MAGAPGDYSAVFATVGLARLEEEAIRLSAELDADGAPAQASLVRQAFVRLLEELKTIARTTAGQAELFIKEAQLSTRVRPDTGGGGGPRLGDFVGESHPLPGVEGSVGINDERVLEDNVPWWWTNEEGYSGHVGRQVTGLFFDSGFTSPSRPDPGRFREHPLFAVGKGIGKQGGKGTRMTIQNPIPERRFVRDGMQRAETEWHAAIRTARTRFLGECQRAVAAAPPPKVRPLGGSPRKRRP